jgi:3-hydroxyisobutyrate dehydrogenase
MAIQQDRMRKPDVGLLGVGPMGSAMAARLVDLGFEVIAWDREAANVLSLDGVEVAASPDVVVADAPIVITMLPTAPVVLDVVGPLLAGWPEGTIWLQMTSVGATEADRLTEFARQHDVTLIDAPVSGSSSPAREGLLTILAAGPESARERVAPVLSALSHWVIWAGAAGSASRLRLAANHWMLCSLAASAETMLLCEAIGLDQGRFAALLDGGAFESPHAVETLAETGRDDHPAGIPVRLALKDIGLLGGAEDASGLEMPILGAALGRYEAVGAGAGDYEATAAYEVLP